MHPGYAAVRTALTTFTGALLTRSHRSLLTPSRCHDRFSHRHFSTTNSASMPIPPSPAATSIFEQAQDGPDRPVIVLITTDKHEEAEKLAGDMLDKDLIACANLIPRVTSIYKWQGKIEKDEEILMVCKTATSKVEEVTAFVCHTHSYDEPEVIALDIQSGSKGYLDWVRDCVHSGATGSTGGSGI